jgi:hypothetical protein
LSSPPSHFLPPPSASSSKTHTAKPSPHPPTYLTTNPHVRWHKNRNFLTSPEPTHQPSPQPSPPTIRPPPATQTPPPHPSTRF